MLNNLTATLRSSKRPVFLPSIGRWPFFSSSRYFSIFFFCFCSRILFKYGHAKVRENPIAKILSFRVYLRKQGFFISSRTTESFFSENLSCVCFSGESWSKLYISLTKLLFLHSVGIPCPSNLFFSPICFLFTFSLTKYLKYSFGFAVTVARRESLICSTS